MRDVSYSVRDERESDALLWCYYLLQRYSATAALLHRARVQLQPLLLDRNPVYAKIENRDVWGQVMMQESLTQVTIHACFSVFSVLEARAIALYCNRVAPFVLTAFRCGINYTHQRGKFVSTE